MKITIYDVAEKAGVSISTVSRVINGTGRVNEKTKKKVRQVIEETDYQPSVVATALAPIQPDPGPSKINRHAMPLHRSHRNCFHRSLLLPRCSSASF